MGPASSDEESLQEIAELVGLEPTDDEMRAEANEEGQRGELNSFGPPNKLPPRRDGPEGRTLHLQMVVSSQTWDRRLFRWHFNVGWC